MNPSQPANPEVTAPHESEPVSTLHTAIHEPAEASTTPRSSSGVERYRLGDEIARGGMGAVYRAEDIVLGREVAVKVLLPELAGTSAAERFFDEARVTARLQHPSVPPVHDLGILPDGRPFLAMKLIRGKTLADELRARTSLTENLERFTAAFEQICLAVAFAHSRRVIHRDLKPLNIMVGSFGEVQVMDWGLARELRNPESKSQQAVAAASQFEGAEDRTRAGAILGTPAYMPPEQARGEPADERSDVFALGGVLCAILTGLPPYTGASGHEVWQKAAAADLAEAITRLGEVDFAAGQFPSIAKRCLFADPSRRFAHAGEVAAAVHAAQMKAREVQRDYELSVATEDADRLQRRADHRARHAVQLGIGGVLLGLVVAGGLWSYANHVATNHETYVKNVQQRYKSDQQDLHPILMETAHRNADEGTFDQGNDATGRSRMAGLLERNARQLEGTQSARMYLLLVGLAELSKDSHSQLYWDNAVKAYAAVVPEQTDIALAVQAVGWVTTHKPSSKLDRAVIPRLREVLGGAAKKPGLPEQPRTDAAAALAKLPAK